MNADHAFAFTNTMLKTDFIGGLENRLLEHWNLDYLSNGNSATLCTGKSSTYNCSIGKSAITVLENRLYLFLSIRKSSTVIILSSKCKVYVSDNTLD